MIYYLFYFSIQHVFNLHEFCQKNWFEGISKDQHAFWKPLDTSIFTPTHLHLKRIPGTFKPVRKVHSTVTQRAKLKGEFIILLIHHLIYMYFLLLVPNRSVLCMSDQNNN